MIKNEGVHGLPTSCANDCRERRGNRNERVAFTKPRQLRRGKGTSARSDTLEARAKRNPKGRPKGRKNMKTYFDEAVSRKINIKIGGQYRHITVLEAISVGATAQALKGDHRFISLVLAADEEHSAALEQQALGE